MKAHKTVNPLADDNRPSGIIQPDSEPTRRALRALNERRLEHAEENLSSVAESPPAQRIWNTILRGMLAAARPDAAAAEACFREASGAGPAAAMMADQEPGNDTMRVAAFALHQLGLLFRRRDEPQLALRAHSPAYHIRNEHGSFEELSESALALGIDHDLAGEYEAGQDWHRIAIEASAKTTENVAENQATAWSHLTASLMLSERYEDAVEAARTAREWWHKHDITAVTATRADMKLGHALLRVAASRIETDD
ncbi:MAG: hypothetical protein IH987_04375, partial [Planctomycetes bacterium]|nr:hypothetical protein [Planctomycetota bacterium]